MEATREIYWNIDGKGIMYIIALIALIIFVVGFIQKIRSWHRGRPIVYDNLGLRFKLFFSAIINHDRGVFRGSFRRFMHLSVFYGFLMLTFGTLVIAIQDHFEIPLFYGKKYLILSLLLDLFGLLTMIGIVMATYKRYIYKPDHEEYSYDDAILLILVFTILFTGFLLEGLRIYSTADPWAWWSPVGLMFSVVTQKSGLSLPMALDLHGFLWYFHMLLTFSFIAYIPYSKLFHMVASPLNIFLRSFSPSGTLTPIAILPNGAEKIGAGRLEEFTKKQLLELDACISCGRCQKGCPAYMSGTPLSPKKVIQSLKRHATERNSLFRRDLSKASLIIDKVISKESLLACSTCGLCEEKCPMSIEHVKRIVDMRRSLSSEDKSYPLEVQSIFETLSSKGNPWGLSQANKYYFAGESQIPQLSEKKQTDILYWVGCFGSYESRNQKVSQAMFKILDKAGIDYAVLGMEEKCCGDSVRRLGNEKLFQQLAHENILNLNRYEFKTIVTHCPHCFNTLKNEYPQFGGNYQVIHHSEFILDLIKSQKINLKGVQKGKVTFHDPCYLGRYNALYQAPREVLASIPGLELVEMKNNRTWAFCCGGGGGRVWVKNESDAKDARINDLLVKKALRTESDILASACSLCLTTLTEAISTLEADIENKDIAELVSDALD
ncbi:heterodisulfide reductase-related iron-sulfur binding cluster [Desulfosporosinus sp. BICA1-9]|uniref:heterodisulfide reductase-related iron-sulfur binding cluster n=1 Tax=Desulfosporosinus sp. BICA1-9 TaxID=1531958 RepID=UPI00054C3C8C|nr:heterodisulfide reductase-related iron-sulfur binding cluster [Desulfosporosinus sp. BICA1-9]KJS50368.1 MAG: Fe-S oxidoreductase [Peptococcaceae bacterium BRH_c23]KJS87408.1 MAG: Fe-S oxidoreductase [Desulfosporosinus sp. BICA1-9]